MTRLAFDLGNWTNDVPFNGTAVLTPDQVAARSRHLRAAPGCGIRARSGRRLDQLQTVRKYYDFTDVDTDRYQIDGDPAPGHALGAASSPSSRTRRRPAGSTSGSSTPTASASRWSRSTRSAARASRTCSSATCRRSRPPARRPSPSRASTSASGPSSYIVIGAQEDEFDYPTGETDTGGSVGTQTRWTGTTGIKLDTTLMRLLFAARFRDLDLLISNQVTADSQLLFHRSLSDRLPLIAPFLRYDKDPYLVIDDVGRIWSTSRTRTRPPTGSRTRSRSIRARWSRPTSATDDVQLHPQQRQDHGRRLRRHDALLRRRPGRPDHPRLRRASSRRCSSRSTRCRPTCAPTSGCPRSCSTSRPRCSAATT